MNLRESRILCIVSTTMLFCALTVKIKTSDELIAKIQQLAVGDVVEVGYQRGQQTRRVRVALSARAATAR